LNASAQKSISVVDDDGDVRDSLQVLLESFGFRVRTFPSSPAFLADPAAARAHLLLFDVNMPGMSGVELLEAVRARGVLTPVMFVTADPKKFETRMKLAGASAILRKPFNDVELMAEIDRILGGDR